MAYTVLARRYRSTTFDEVIGQEHVAQTLKKAIASNRIAHAFLFNGTRGVGKTSMARILAKALNCESSDGPTPTPCNKCTSCLAIARGDDMDVIEIDAASNTGVDNVRDIIENSQYRPARSRSKIYIIDEVHMLSKNAFNALLKTLEEPPSHVKFILATTEPEKVLPTIHSRCQRYDFRNIPTREIAGHLRNICQLEQIDAEEDALLLVAKAGAGSMRDSLSLLDRLLSIGEKKLTVEMIEQLLGMPRAQAIYDLTQSIGEADVKATLMQADKLIAGGLSVDTLIASLTDHLRNLLIIRTCGIESKLVEVLGLSPKDLTAQASRFEPVILTQDITILEELRRQLRVSQAGRALLDATLVRLALAEQFAPIDELLAAASNGAGASSSPALKKNVEPIRPALSAGAEDRPRHPERSEGSGPAAAQLSPALSPSAPVAVEDDDDDALPAVGKVWDNSGPSLSELLKQAEGTSSEPQANVEPVQSTDITGIWSRLLEVLEAKAGPSLPPLLEHAQLSAIEQDTAVLRFTAEHRVTANMLDRNGKKELVRDALAEVLNRAVALKIDVEPSPEPQRPTRPAALTAPPRRQRDIRAELAAAAEAAPAHETPNRLTAELKQQVASDPLVAAVMRELGGEIVKVE